MVKNLLKKVCLVVSVLLGLGSNVQAQEAASVTFTEDGKTLTISGQGDLTTYSGDVTVTTFAAAANGKVSQYSWGGDIIAGQTYHPATQYYAYNSETYKWNAISDNASYFAEHSTYFENKVQKISFAQMLANQLKNNYETVRFVNDEPATPMYVDEEILQKFFYTVNENATNMYLKTLDLGAVTCKNFSSNFLFKATDSYPIATNLVLENLTLPLNETKIVPSSVISKLSSKDYSLKKVIVPEGYEKLDKQCFSEKSSGAVYTPVSGKTFSLPSTLLEIGDDAFRECDFSEITLPENLKTIGKYAFTSTGLTSITFPKNLDKIDDGAFWELKNFLVIELNDNLRYIGNGAFGCSGDLADKSKTQTTIKIPASVKYIGAYAFSERKFQDIYFLGKVAPVCPVGDFFDGQTMRTDGTAFTGTDDKVHYGNSGFSLSGSNGLADNISEGYANRENYVNGGYYFTILHYPADATDEDTFTDTTRKYDCRVKENGTIDLTQIPVGTEEAGSLDYREATHVQTSVDPGYADTYLGTQYVWPSHAQFVRAYATAANGVKWNGKDVYAPDLGDDVKAVLKEAGYDTNDENLANLAKIAYVGTRKFTISNDDSKSTPEYKITMKPGQWWTLCVPFNMTKKQVLDTFGSDTQLCLFNKVTRDLGVNGKNKIVLYFTQDVLNHSTKNADGTKMKDANGMWSENIAAATDNVAEDDVVLWAHESYMIKPYNGEQSDQDAVFVVKNYEDVEGNPLPTVVQSTTTVQSRQASETKEYRFVGNYLGNENAKAAKMTIPQYSYVYANTKSDPVYKFRFYTGKTSTWKPNKSLVQTNERNGGVDDYNNFFGIDNTSSLPASSKQASVFGGENFGETTGIEDVTIVAGTDTLAPVFNLEGKMVSANGDAAGLPAGIYVKNGQKFIVK